MKTKKVIIRRSKLGYILFCLQLALVLPIMIPTVLLYILTEAIVNGWVSYKNWFLSKVQLRKEVEEV